MTREDSYTARYRFKKDGKRHILIYSDVTLEDRGRYQVMTNGGQCEADLIVEGEGLGGGASPCSPRWPGPQIRELNLILPPCFSPRANPAGPSPRVRPQLPLPVPGPAASCLDGGRSVLAACQVHTRPLTATSPHLTHLSLPKASSFT